MIKYFFSKQFLSFVGVGGVAALLHWLSRILLSQWISLNYAVAIAYVIGMLIAFVLNSYFVFPKSMKPKIEQCRDFVVINIAFFPIVWIATILLKNLFSFMGITLYPDALAHGVALSIPMFGTFLIYKFFTFRKN
jgi:putative flippase GtrA